jgi:hypothetical protein
VPLARITVAQCDNQLRLLADKQREHPSDDLKKELDKWLEYRLIAAQKEPQ